MPVSSLLNLTGAANLDPKAIPHAVDDEQVRRYLLLAASTAYSLVADEGIPHDKLRLDLEVDYDAGILNLRPSWQTLVDAPYVKDLRPGAGRKESASDEALLAAAAKSLKTVWGDCAEHANATLTYASFYNDLPVKGPTAHGAYFGMASPKELPKFPTAEPLRFLIQVCLEAYDRP